MSRISAVIATKNEENNIRQCLESVKWADEIIVVDDVSTDKTLDICREYNSKIYVNDSKGSFHVNKNLGLDYSSGDWILSIDADERVTQELSQEVQDIITKTDNLGYYVSRKNYFLGKWIRGNGWYPDYIIRLFRRGVTRWPLNIHDVPKIRQKDKVAYLFNPLIHISYTSIEQYLDKFAKYTTRLASEEFEKGIRVRKANFLSLLLFKPSFRLFRKYVFMRGYIDGFRGLFISVASAMTIFMTYAKLWEMQNKK